MGKSNTKMREKEKLVEREGRGETGKGMGWESTRLGERLRMLLHASQWKNQLV